MPVVLNGKKLIAAVLEGDVVAGVELARGWKAGTVTELLAVVCPDGQVSVGVLDTCADAIALMNRTNREGK